MFLPDPFPTPRADLSDAASGGSARRDSHQVPLSVAPAAWFRLLEELAPAIHLARTSVAMLGMQGPLSPVRSGSSPVLPQSECGRYLPNLAEHASLWAVQEEHAEGLLSLLEVRDARGQVGHRIVVPAGTTLGAYLGFVDAYGAPAAGSRPWFPPNHAASSRRVGSLTGRMRALRQRLAGKSPEVRWLPLNRVIGLLQQAIASEFTIRTAVYNRSLFLSSVWMPEFQAPDLQATDPSLPRVSRFFGDDTGLELYHDPGAVAVLWTGVCSCCGREKWAIEMGTADDELALSIAAVDDSQESEWRAFLQESLG
ncbi:MAG: hypothetical protein KIT22_04470 [Verrucomicrobiae bacterium]|nr:hypothetical protein [Verrucomicrobiae bacterium]